MTDVRKYVDMVAELGKQRDALRAEFEQYKAWAEPQIVTHGQDVLLIDRLRGLLRETLDAHAMNGEDWLHLCLRIHAAIGAADQPAECRHTYREIDPWNRQCADCGHRVLTCPQCGVERAADNSPEGPA